MNTKLEREKCCCFTGHRNIDREDEFSLPQALEKTIESLIHAGVTDFICGGALGFDTIAAITVLKLKSKYESVRLILFLPCRHHDQRWTTNYRRTFQSILKKADLVFYLSEEYHNGCMLARNRQMIADSSYCICYLRGLQTGTSYTVKHAKKMNLKIIYL